MDINFDKGVVTLYEKNIKLDPLIKRLSLLSGEQVYHFLSNRGIQIPRAFNCYALISVLNQRIKFLHSKSLSKDYFQRLQYYKYFTEQQLFNLFRKIANDEESFYMYRYNFFKLLLLNFVSLNLNDGEVTYLKNLKKGKIESFEEYFNYISSSSLEMEGSFDGISIEELKSTLPLSASNQDIFDLAGKYGIELPTRLKKKQFLDFIAYYMKKNNDYNDAIAEELEAMTMAQLSTYARRTGIPMQAAMSKNDLITYLFYYLDQCEIDYTSIKRVELSDEFTPLVFTIDFSQINSFQSDEAVKVIHYDGEDNDVEEFNEVIKEDIEDVDVTDGEEVAKVEPTVAEPEVKETKVEETKVEEPEVKEPEDVEPQVDAKPEAEIVEEAMVEDIPLQEEILASELIEETLVDEPEEIDDTHDFEVQYVSDEYKASELLEDEPIDEPVEEPVEESRNEASKEANSDDISDEEIQAIIDEHTNKNNPEAKEEKPLAKDINNMDLSVSENDNYGNSKLMKLAKGKGKKVAITICILIVIALLGAVAYLYFKK